MTVRPRLLAVAALCAAFGLVSASDAKIDRWLADRFEVSPSESFLVLFDTSSSLDRVLAQARESADARREVYTRLATRARTTQADVRRMLRAKGIAYKPLWIVNGLQVTGSRALAESLAARAEVVRIVGDPWVYGLSATTADGAGVDSLEWGLLAIHADQVWSQDGARGAGIVVASADTGVEWTHPAIQGKYRGWDGASAVHDFNWHDAIEDLAAPIDDNDHGTHTTGTMVGDDGAGNQIGVAPDARWIACRNMDHGNGRPSTYLDCNQWLLAPYPHGGDPEIDGDPSKAPDIVNNSWGCPPSEGCDAFVLEDSFKALRAAGILAVAAAGNSGPSCNTVSDPPAIYEEALVAGATDSTTTLAFFSSRGNVTVDGSGRLRPDVAAPGVSVRSAVRGGGYASFSGTSMASPHTAGAAALLWSAKPQVKNLVRISRCLISRSAPPTVRLQWGQSCGGTGRTTRPNNLFGWGLVDAYGAIHFGPDADADGIADACDCAASNGGAYDPPGEIAEVGFTGKTTLVWASLSREAGNGTIYDVVRGTLDDLRASGSISGGSCLGSATTDASRTDAETPFPDAGFYYVVQARNTCGSGGWGAASSGTARSHADCP